MCQSECNDDEQFILLGDEQYSLLPISIENVDLDDIDKFILLALRIWSMEGVFVADGEPIDTNNVGNIFSLIYELTEVCESIADSLDEKLKERSTHG